MHLKKIKVAFRRHLNRSIRIALPAGPKPDPRALARRLAWYNQSPQEFEPIIIAYHSSLHMENMKEEGFIYAGDNSFKDDMTKSRKNG